MSIDGLVANFAAATDRRYGTAIHEAGHAVVAALIGALGGRVTIEADHEATGHTWVLTPSGLRKRWRRRWFDQGMRPYTEWQLRYALILACAAGREAEELCLGRCAGRDGTDQQKIAAMLDDLPGADADRDRYARQVRAATRTIVRRHRAAIERVAKLLLEQGSATADQVVGEIKAARGPNPPYDKFG